MKHVIAFILLFVSLSAIADDYYWTIPALDPKFPTPRAACDAYQKGYTEPDYYLAYYSFSATEKGCEVRRGTAAGTLIKSTSIYRQGNGCPVGATYNDVTGACDANNKCEALKGNSTPFSKSGTAPDGYMSLSGKISAPSQGACYSGCAVSTVDQKCTTKVKGNYFCRGTAVYTGEECPSGSVTPTVDTSSSSSYPDAQTTNSSEPCLYKSDGKGGYTCSSSTSTESEGQNCGSVNGKTVCVDKLPSSQTNKIDTQVNTTTNSDGSSKTDKTDVSTVTTCSGINSCTSTSTTTNTTVTKDSAGNKTSETSSSTGSGSTNGVAKDGSGEGESEGGISDPGLPETPNYIERAGYGDAKADYDETAKKFYEKIGQAPIVTAIKGFSLQEGGSCPNLSANTMFGTFAMTDFCQSMAEILAQLGPIMLLFWAIVAIRVFASA